MNKTKKYDLIIVLGSQPDPNNWQFPSHVFKSLDKATELYRDEMAPLIALSGKWAIRFDFLNITQPFRECDEMERYLLTGGIPQEAILKEGKSVDTISNLYFLKTTILEPKNIKRLVIITADFRAERIRFLCDKILGPGYMIDIETVSGDPAETYPHEAQTFAFQRKFLANMKPGDAKFLDDKFYSDPYYQELEARLKRRGPSERMFS